MTNATLIAGPLGSSKTTLWKLLVELMGNPRLIFGIDSKRCFELSRKYRTLAGKALLALQDDQDKGLILPGRLVVQSILENFEWIKKELGSLHIAVAGCGRSPEEIQEWDRAVRARKVSRRFFFIECSEDEIELGIQARIESCEMRVDDGPNEVKTRKEEYKLKTLPAMASISRELVKRTTRSKSLTARLYDLVYAIDIEDDMRDILLRRLKAPNHPIHKSIQKVENGLKDEVADTRPSLPSRPPVWFEQPHVGQVALRA